MSAAEIDYEEEDAGFEEAPTADEHEAGRKKGRGHLGRSEMTGEERYAGRGGVFESVEAGAGVGPARCAWRTSARRAGGRWASGRQRATGLTRARTATPRPQPWKAGSCS